MSNHFAKRNLCVIGLGNPLMGDEGIGIRLVEELAKRSALDGVEFIDAGTMGMTLLHLINGKRKVFFIDCALMGEAPGTLCRFTPEEVATKKLLSGFSLHEGDLLQLLALSRTLGESPDEVVIFGIEPVEITPGTELSPLLEAHVQEYCRVILEEIEARRVAVCL